jgi:hypothetical protein
MVCRTHKTFYACGAVVEQNNKPRKEKKCYKAIPLFGNYFDTATDRITAVPFVGFKDFIYYSDALLYPPSPVSRIPLLSV